MTFTTLESIFLTSMGGLVVTAMSLLAFGITVQRQFALSAAPRCIARHPNTIYKPRSEARGDSQVRGNPFTGWIGFVMGLSYDEMMMGVRGTGTRDEGYSGTLLRLNLDGIVLLRFHSLCLRTSILVTVLAIGVLLPLNWTGSCHVSSDGEFYFEDCRKLSNRTNYEQTTIDNIVSINSFSLGGSDQSLLDPYAWTRYYVIVVISWIYAFYVCKILRVEWKEILAIRRVYYLESDHFQNRNAELVATEIGSNSTTGQTSTFQKLQERVKHRRNAEIPHPDSRDTVPNIELYTVLVKGVPSMPSDVVENDNDIESLFQSNTVTDGIDWQLAVTTSFFDSCIPAQHGFTSSVAAVTILPDANEIATAWRKWYAAATVLRRLRYVRSIIADRRYNYGYDFYSRKNSESNSILDDGNEIDVRVHDNETFINDIGHDERALNIGLEDNFMHIEDNLFLEEMNQTITNLGGDDVEEVEDFMLQALQFGPEQKAVYRREIAQSAAACCPFGCREERLRYLRIDDLIELEKELRSDIVNASVSLREAQRRAADSAAFTASSNTQTGNPDENLHNIVETEYHTNVSDCRDPNDDPHDTDFATSNRLRCNTDSSSRGVIESFGPKRVFFNSEGRLHTDNNQQIFQINDESNRDTPVRRRVPETRVPSDRWKQVTKIRNDRDSKKISNIDFRRSGVWGLPSLSCKNFSCLPRKRALTTDAFSRKSSFAGAFFSFY